MKKVCCIITSLFFTTSVFASNLPLDNSFKLSYDDKKNVSYAETKTDKKVDKVITYINGMNTSLDSAIFNRAHLGKTLDGKLQNHRVDLAYNKSDTGLQNYVQAFYQGYVFELEKYSQTRNIFKDFWQLLDIPDSSPDKALALKNAPIISETQYNESLDLLDSDFIIKEDIKVLLPNIKTHVQKMEGFIRDGKTVVLVPHSQGYFYANSSLQLLLARYSEARDRLYNVGLAPSSTILMPNSAYFTNYRDKVVFSVRLAIPNVLPGNITIEHPAKNIWQWALNKLGIGSDSGHGFQEDYLSGGEHTDKIVNQIVTFANKK